jgi:hypothetical protein
MRGTGIRPVSRIRGIGCPATIVATVTKNPRNKQKLCVKVTQVVSIHNHSVNAYVWNQYAENRAIKCDETLAGVHNLVKYKSPFSKIFEYVNENTGN